MDAKPALPWLSDMRIRDYTVKADDTRHTGVIAQEMLKVHPDMVHTLDNGIYTVDAPSQWKLVKAIQEIKSLFDTDHDEIAQLKADNDNLRAANENEAKQFKAFRDEFDAYKARHP